MPYQTAVLIGCPGAGKTRELLEIMDKVLATGICGPERVGFVTFTRSARREAATRAADRYSVQVPELERLGWFRTLHSICYRQIGGDDGLLTDDKKSRDWMQNALQEDVRASDDGGEDRDYAEVFDTRTETGVALQLWSAARNRMEPLRDTWTRAWQLSDRVPGYELVEAVVRQYEEAKFRDSMRDFTDLLLLYSGWRHDVEGVTERTPVGDVPDIPVWLLDEQQDTSELQRRVLVRLTDPAKWVYLVGDPMQAIYDWAGADHRILLNWPNDKRRIMHKSWRCARPILDLGESIASRNDDWFDRQLEAADHEGVVEREWLSQAIETTVNPSEEWMILFRANHQAETLATWLDKRGVPWQPVRGRGGWNAPKRNLAFSTLLELEQGGCCDGTGWRACLDFIPQVLEGSQLLVRGTKKQFKELEKPEELHPFLTLGTLAEAGATESLRRMIAAGEWSRFDEAATGYAAVARQWGKECADNPKIKLATIHQSKGMEADNVLLVNSLPGACVRAMNSPEGTESENRVFYVGATRARKRLVIASERGQRRFQT